MRGSKQTFVCTYVHLYVTPPLIIIIITGSLYQLGNLLFTNKIVRRIVMLSYTVYMYCLITDGHTQNPRGTFTLIK